MSMLSRSEREAAGRHRHARLKRVTLMAAWVGVPEPGTKWIPVWSKSEILKAIVDASDYSHLNQVNWSLNNYGYVVHKCRGRSTLMHREILQTKNGVIVDHINHNKLDNRRANIRECNHRQNQGNRVKMPGFSSPYKGVSFSKRDNVFRAFCKDMNSKSKNLGSFATEREAALAYNAYASKHFGEFALLNIIP